MVAVDWYGGLSKWQYTGAGLHSRLLEQEGQWEVICIFLQKYNFINNLC